MQRDISSSSQIWLSVQHPRSDVIFGINQPNWIARFPYSFFDPELSKVAYLEFFSRATGAYFISFGIRDRVRDEDCSPLRGGDRTLNNPPCFGVVALPECLVPTLINPLLAGPNRPVNCIFIGNSDSNLSRSFGSVSPTGCVAITDGTRYCDVVLSGTGGSSTGSCTITEPTPGTVNFSATYSGDPSYTSTSTTSSVTVSVSDPIVAPPMITTTTIPTLPVSTASSLASTGDDFLLPIGVSAVLFVYGAGVLFVRRRKA